MAWPDHYLVRFEGTSGTPVVENWSIGYRLARTGGGPLIGTNSINPRDYVRNEAMAFITHLFDYVANYPISNHVRLAAIKCNRIGPDGRYAGGHQEEPVTLYAEEFPAPVVGKGTGPHLPFQVSLVASMTTAAARGYASRGRMFLPPMAGQIAATGRLMPGAAAAWAGVVAGALAKADVSQMVGQDIFRPCVVSPSGNGGDGTIREITGVRVGDVMDTQRRRREEIDEVYASAVVAY